MSVVKTVTNSECVIWRQEYEPEVQAIIDDFESTKELAAVDDTIEIACGYVACALRMEKYIKIVHGSRVVRNGIFPAPCMVNEESRQQR